jgi:VWFA-related protein
VAGYLREGTHAGDWVRLVNLSTGGAWDGRIPHDRVRLEAAARSLSPRGSAWAGGDEAGVPAIDDRVELEPGGGAASAAETSGRFLSVFAQASDLLGSLEALLVELSGVGGRKGVVLVSPGFPQLRNLDDRLERVATLARDAATAVYFVDVAAFDGLLPERGPLRPVFELVWARSGGAQDLAEATGGFTYRLSNSLAPALSRVAGEMRTYYVVGYLPARPHDGSFRSVEVRVRVPGLKARTKKGYLATP